VPISFDATAWSGTPHAILTVESGNSAEPLSPLTVRLEISGMDLEPTSDGFHQISIGGLAPLVTPGNPEMLTAGKILQMPEGWEAELEITHHEEKEWANTTIRPAQRKFRCPCPSAFAFNKRLYQSTGLYPPQIARLEKLGHWQNRQWVRLAFYPVRQDPAGHRLVITTRLTAQVRFSQAVGAWSTRPLAPLSRGLWDMAQAGDAAATPLEKPADAAETMIIITADALRNALAPFLVWKRARGLRVEVYSTSEAGHTPEEVKEFLRRRYLRADAKPTYLLMVGDAKLLPPFKLKVTTSPNGPAATDYPFSLLSGNGPVPDLLYGRLVASNADDVSRQTSRWIEYERDPQPRAAWYAQATTIASEEGEDPSDEQYAQQVENALRQNTYRSVDRFYEKAHTATVDKISHALEEGRSWLSYFGHGSGTGWLSTNDDFDNEAVGALTNFGRLPVVVDAACDNASFVRLPIPFGRAWVSATLQGKNTGAVGYYGASVSTSWNPPALMSVGIARQHFEKPVATLGGTVLAGQMYVLALEGMNDDTLDNLYFFNIFV
jgi:hypothetical protein